MASMCSSGVRFPFSFMGRAILDHSKHTCCATLSSLWPLGFHAASWTHFSLRSLPAEHVPADQHTLHKTPGALHVALAEFWAYCDARPSGLCDRWIPGHLVLCIAAAPVCARISALCRGNAANTRTEATHTILCRMEPGSSAGIVEFPASHSLP